MFEGLGCALAPALEDELHATLRTAPTANQAARATTRLIHHPCPSRSLTGHHQDYESRRALPKIPGGVQRRSHPIDFLLARVRGRCAEFLEGFEATVSQFHDQQRATSRPRPSRSDFSCETSDSAPRQVMCPADLTNRNLVFGLDYDTTLPSAPGNECEGNGQQDSRNPLIGCSTEGSKPRQNQNDGDRGINRDEPAVVSLLKAVQLRWPDSGACH